MARERATDRRFTIGWTDCSSSGDSRHKRRWQARPGTWVNFCNNKPTFMESMVGVLLGNGDGAFQPAVTFVVGRRISFWVSGVTRFERGRSTWWRRRTGRIREKFSLSVLLNNTPFCANPPVVTLSSATPTYLWPPKTEKGCR